MPVHLLLSHFPIVLFVLGATLDVVGALTGRPPARRAAGWMLILGAGLAFAAFLTGQGALMRALGANPPDPTAVEMHTRWGGAGVWVLAIAGVTRALWRERFTGVHGWVNVLVALVGAGLVVAITVTGTAIRHAG